MSSQSLNISDHRLSNLKQPSIHTLTQVQPHGVILVLHEPDMAILQVSRNASTLLG